MRLTQLVLLVLVSTPALGYADNWPQWMGPKRDNVWREDGLVEKFPEGGPKVVWRTPVAGGYAGPAVAPTTSSFATTLRGEREGR